MSTARKRASVLSSEEVEDALNVARTCIDHIRECRATEDVVTALRTQLLIAQGIEDRRIVRGFRAEFQSALDAIEAINSRSKIDGKWRQSALYPTELAALVEAVRWHAFQLKHVSAGELHQIATKLIAQTRSSGGELRTCSLSDLAGESRGRA